MTKAKSLIVALFVVILLILIPNISNATVEVSRNVYSNNGSMKFDFKGLTLDTTHEYEFGITKTKAEQVETWYLLTEYTANTATVDISTMTEQMNDVFNAVDTGYITIKDKTAGKVVLEPYGVNLKLPYLKVADRIVVNNGAKLDGNGNNNIKIPTRTAGNSSSYYQYEKITDQDVINKYKEIKEKNGDFNELQSILKITPPSSNWRNWSYWNGHGIDISDYGYGYPESTINVPDTGLYYMWLYFSGSNLKNIYGYILVDNLEAEVALESISLPKTREVELGKTLKLSPTFNPEGATDKRVTWSSSNEDVATVDNAGVITPKKLGSTVITVVSQSGGKKATCTVTVVEASKGNDTNNNNGANSGNNNSGTNNNKDNKNQDSTTIKGVLPKTGIGKTIIVSLTVIVIAIGGIVVFYRKYKTYNV